MKGEREVEPSPFNFSFKKKIIIFLVEITLKIVVVLGSGPMQSFAVNEKPCLFSSY